MDGDIDLSVVEMLIGPVLTSQDRLIFADFAKARSKMNIFQFYS